MSVAAHDIGVFSYTFNPLKSKLGIKREQYTAQY